MVFKNYKNILILFFILMSFTHAKALVTEYKSSLPANSQFKAEASMKARVDFWKRIYSEISEQEGLFHNIVHPEIVYKKISFSSILENKLLTASEKENLIEHKINSERVAIAKQYKIKDIKEIRLQMGLQERTQKAFFESGKYLSMMEGVFKKKNLPIELTRLVFVESSFNIKAQSKVGASGLWQIMPFVAREEGYIKPFYDKRNHPYYSTLLAADMLKQNYRSTHNWGLAVTAYNHGLGGVKKMARLNNTNKIEKLISAKNNTRTWGFASENFYACFLAILEVERHSVALFDEPLLKAQPLPMHRVVLKKTVKPRKVLDFYGGRIAYFKELNPHLNHRLIEKIRYIPRGTPLVLPKPVGKNNQIVSRSDI